METQVKKYYCLSEEQLKELVKAKNNLEALKCGGVDNWSYYYDALDEYYSDNAEMLGFSPAGATIRELANLIAQEEIKTEYQQISDWRMP